MAIEVDIPVEIEDYREKIIFGMSLRQLACFTTAVVLAVGTYFLFTRALGWTMDATSYVIIFESLPLMALGFIRKDGQPFEKYFALFLRQQIGNKKLPYTARLAVTEHAPEKGKSKYAWIFEKGNGKNGVALSKKERKAESLIKEAAFFQTDRKRRKVKGRVAVARIKAAQKERRLSARRIAEENRSVEKQLSLFLQEQNGIKKLPYIVGVEQQGNKPEVKELRNVWIFKAQGESSTALSHGERREEAVIFKASEKGGARTSKETRQRIKNATKEYRAAKRREEEASKERSGG